MDPMIHVYQTGDLAVIGTDERDVKKFFSAGDPIIMLSTKYYVSHNLKVQLKKMDSGGIPASSDINRGLYKVSVLVGQTTLDYFISEQNAKEAFGEIYKLRGFNKNNEPPRFTISCLNEKSQFTKNAFDEITRYLRLRIRL